MGVHDCVTYLKEVINLKNQRIIELLDENDRLKNNVVDSDERGQINPFNIGMVLDQ